MESVLSSDDSCDREIKSLKHQLTEYGLDEDNLSKEEMVDLLKALTYSKTIIQEEEASKTADVGACKTPPKVIMKRRYLNVKDRRMPWSLFPTPLTPAEKARTLAAYIKVMSINNYRQARQSVNLASWPLPIQIVESTRVQPLRSTRSGRSVPVYTDFDDDSSDFDQIITKTKKRKVSTNDQIEVVNTKKGLSLKRKLPKDENNRPMKEARIIEIHKIELDSHDVYSIED
ncbi:uncharacterized protein [Maniola hyperantus]|uniref:uncharacterized protein n=1 Tax=Aphantopus hyperantus TaxID=2795564 RepID=UPI00156A3B61|nr:uncharacterized protein LOC117984704 [Maniola hyperantus]XP_034827242.1 uncharacterized protein LOC117984704 [Maniola hyperantus]